MGRKLLPAWPYGPFIVVVSDWDGGIAGRRAGPRWPKDDILSDRGGW